VTAPGVPVTTFTQQQILNGEVRFVHDGSGIAPTFTISVTDGSAGVGPFVANIVFNGGGGGVVPPPPPGGGGGSTTVTPPVVSTTSPVRTLGTPGLGTRDFRPPTALADGGASQEAGTVKQSEPGVMAKLPAAQDQTLAIRAQSEALDTTPTRAEFQAEPVRGELQVLPTSHAFDPDDAEKHRIEVVMGSVKITGLALSVGAVWWAARAVGLVASLLASAPAWRHLDPLPVLGRGEEEEQARPDAAGDEDEEDKREEHRARWVLEGN
jgi:hypothetical protein